MSEKRKSQKKRKKNSKYDIELIEESSELELVSKSKKKKHKNLILLELEDEFKENNNNVVNSSEEISGNSEDLYVKHKKKKKHKKSSSPKRVSLDIEEEDNSLTICEEICDNLEDNKHQQSKNQQEIQWTKQDILKLVERIEDNIPEDDNLSFYTRLDKLNWENIKFKNYTIKECQKAWTTAHKTVRKYRLVKEIIADIKKDIKTKKQKSRTLPKHPNMPKYPRSAYMYYFLEIKPSLIDENPGIAYGEVLKRIGEMYRNLQPEIRAKYEKIASDAFKEYSGKLKLFYAEHPELIPKKKEKVTGEEVDETEEESDNDLKQLLKKPKTPFELYFSNELEKEENVTDLKSFKLKCRKQWFEIGNKEKLNWIKLAEKNHEYYLKEIAAYSKLYCIKLNPVKSILNKQEKLLLQQLAGKPIEPPTSAYHLFMQILKKRGEIEATNFKDFPNYIAEKWNSCTEDERSDYKQRCKELWEQYYTDLASYLETLPPKERDEILNKKRKRKYGLDVIAKKKTKGVRSVNNRADKRKKIKIDLACERFLNASKSNNNLQSASESDE